MWNHINRTTVRTEENKYRLYAKSAPINYKKSDGTFDTIDHTFNDTTSSIGEISLMDKGVMSVGKRKGNNPHKVVGIRPDKNQHLGTQQLEFSLVNVELDGVSQSFNVETDLEIKLESARVLQLVKANNDFNDFKIEFDIHNTGLELQNSKYSNTTTIREDFGFNLHNLGNVEGGNTDKTFNNIFTDNRTNPYIDSCIFQITNNYITTGQYSNTEEFGDSDLSNYVIDDNVYPNGGAAYLKDCIVLIAKTHNIQEVGVEEIFVNKMCNEYGLETIWEDGENGQYFTKDGKKVASYYSIGNNFYMFINTKAIPDDVKTLFQRKTFNDTSFLNITLSDFNTTITNMFNTDLTIDLNTDYYEPINNKFVFKVNNESFYINPPTLFDESYNVLELETIHSLKQNNDGSYRYTKYFSLIGYLKNSHNIKYIDADLAAATGEDAITSDKKPSGFGTSTANQYTSTNHNALRNSTTANSTFARTASDNIVRICSIVHQKTTVTNNGVTTTSYFYLRNQNAYKFDSSGISDAVTSATFKIKGRHNNTGTSTPADFHLILLKASLTGTEVVANWNDFVGHTSGWGASDVTEYTAEHVCTDSSMTFQNITLNSDARSDLQSLDDFEFILEEKEEVYDDSFDHHGAFASSTSAYTRAFDSISVNAPTTSLRPYIEFETGASGYGHKVAGVAAASISKVKGVATANIGKVIGVD
jgi:hypothetical protein